MKPCALPLALALLWPTAVLAGEQTVTLAVDNLSCALCPITVAAAIEAVPGVSAVTVDDGTDTAVVTFDDGLASVDQIAAASTNAGYPARLAQ